VSGELTAFDAAAREVQGEPLTFSLGGREWRTRKRMPFALLATLAKEATRGGIEFFDAFSDLVINAVAQDQREEFRAMLYALPEDDEGEAVIEFADLAAVARELVTRLTGSPFDAPSGSPELPLRNGTLSRGPAGSAATVSHPPRRVKL